MTSTIEKQAPLVVVTLKRATEMGNYIGREFAKGPFDRCVSRLNYKPDFYHFVLKGLTVKEVIDSPSKNLDWLACCESRAEELLKLNKEHYFISYSGGIDSTALLVSLMKFWPKEFLNRITIYYSLSSVQENPNFFNKIAKRFQFKHILSDISNELLEKDAVFITGELGDQLFGSDILGVASQKFGDDCLKKNYRDWAPAVIGSWAESEISGKAIFERLHPIVEESPFPIRTTHDFFWWYNFTQKWQYVTYRHMASRSWNLKARYGTQVLHFYDTNDFQKWALQNHDLKIKNTWDSYKFTAKEFIYNFTKDKGDLALTKDQSLGKTYTFTEHRHAITENFESIDSAADLVKYVRQAP